MDTATPERVIERTSSGRRLWWVAAVGLLAALAALAALGAAAWLPQRVPARPEAIAAPVPGSAPFCVNEDCEWMPGQRMMVVDTDSSGRLEVVELDAKTGRSRVLRRFDALLTRRSERCREDLFRISPDGRWLLWRLAGPHPCYLITATHGGPVATFGIAPGVEVEGMAWMPDSRRWVALENRPERTVAVVRTVQTSAPLMETPVPGARDDMVLGVSTRDELITLPVFLPGATNCVVRTIPLSEPDASVRTRRFTAPPWTVAIPRLSPDGTRIAWSAGEDRAVTWLDRLRALMTRVRVPSRRGETIIAVSSLLGTDMRPVIRTTDAPGRGPEAYDPAWLPDGKHLSFWYESERGGRSLWVSPVR